MKKVFAVLFLFSLLSCFSSIFPVKSLAGCLPLNGINCRDMPGYPIVCNTDTSNNCCATQEECNNTPTPNPNSPICPNNSNGINTAIGCIPILGANGTTDFLTWILRWAVGIGSGIAFLLILYSGFMIMTSSGNPERLKAGQELLTSAISGLILLIFSVFILKFIGVDILGLCNFGFGGVCPK